MKRYLVGGAVRDRLLGRPPRERDYVVVGTTPEALRAAGFREVGGSFPVFLHPETGEEHALARTERKSGRGHRGFSVSFGPEVSLEEDLRRRDLTINAIAEAEDGTLIDPYGGLRDLKARVLRHVSEAFIEDPLRVLRVARFAAELSPYGFRVAEETLALMRRMASSGELAELTPERVWKELERALASPQPDRFLSVLRACGALAEVLPEVDALYGVPQRPEAHPEVDAGIHTELVLRQIAELAPGDHECAYAALCHDLGKALTPPELLPRHPGHDQRGLARVRALSARLKVPRAHRELALLACAEHLLVHRAAELRPGTIVELLMRADALRRPQRFAKLLLVCEADWRGRLGREREPYPASERLRRALAAIAAVDAAAIARAKPDATVLKVALFEARCRAVAEALSREPPPSA